MSTYLYKARDPSGKAVSGKMEAATKTELVDKLKAMGYMTTQVTEEKPGVAGIRLETLFDNIKPINAEDMILFYVQFSNMLTAGIPILGALNTLSEQIENKKLREAVGSIARSVEGGSTFSQALSRHPRIFPPLFANMVKAGEVSGKLDTVSEKYAVYFEHQEDLKQKVKGALFYPMILLFAGVAVTLFIVTFVIPKFADIFRKTGIALPVPTQILFGIGVAIKRYWYVGILCAIGIWLGIRRYINTEKGRLYFDGFKLKIPVLGSLYRKAAISGFARTLGTLSASGVPILEALDITMGVLGNEVLSRIVANARKSVEKGEKLSEALKISKEFPPDTLQMISVGEETGNLDTMLDKVADFYDMSVGYTIKKLTTMIEPLFLVIMGSLVGFIMASMLLPMFDMVKTLN